MKLLISILDFADYTAFSKNISAALVEPYIREAQTFDVKLPTAVRAALETQLDAVRPSFKPDEFDGADFSTESTIAGWTDLALAKVWYEAIRPLLVLESARRMLLIHGVHFTPNGVQTISADGQMPISSQLRAELRADLQAKANHYRPLFEAGLRSLSPITVPQVCGTSRRRPSRGGLTTSVV
jgi:hypothetical protein